MTSTENSTMTRALQSARLRTRQYGLRSLLLATTAAAALTAIYSHGARERAIVDGLSKIDFEIRALGGTLSPGPSDVVRQNSLAEWLDWQQKVSFADLRNTNAADAVLANLAKFPHLQTIYLAGTKISDMGLARLAELPDVENLSLADTRITGEGFRAARGLQKLKYLNLSGTNLTSDGLKRLSQFANLRELVLMHAAIDDQALHNLPALAELRSLYLCFTDTSDAGLGELDRFPKLESVGIEATRVSWPAVAVLQTSRPKLRCCVDEKLKRLAGLPN
jgi:hypothetical protein